MNFKLCIYSSFLFFITCTSAKEAYNKGNYISAIKKCLNEINDQKNVRENKKLLNRSLAARKKEIYPKSLSFENLALKEKESSYDQLTDLSKYFEKSQAYLDSVNQVNAKQINLDVNVLKDEIIDSHYSKGRESLQEAIAKKDKILARDAYDSFSKIKNKYKTSMVGLDSLIDLSYEKSIIVINFIIDDGFNISESWDIKRKFENLKNKTKDFKTFYVDKRFTDSDCTIELNFRTIDENKQTYNENKHFEDKIQDGYTIEKDKDGKEIKVIKYKTISADVEIERTTFTLQWRLEADVNHHNSNCNESSNTFRTEKKFEQVVHHIRGDHRVVPSNYKSNSTNTYNKSDLVDDMIDDLYDQVYNYYD